MQTITDSFQSICHIQAFPEGGLRSINGASHMMIFDFIFYMLEIFCIQNKENAFYMSMIQFPYYFYARYLVALKTTRAC
jgi:hypothetical protein